MKIVGQDTVQYIASSHAGNLDSHILFLQSNNSWSIDLYFAVDVCVVLSKESPLVSRHTFHYPISFLERYYTTQQIAINQRTKFELCCVATEILQQFLKGAHLTGASKQMHLESNALALLLCVMEKQHPLPVDLCTVCSFSKNPADTTKIQKAEQLILANLQQPLTIPQLAQKVGLNQCYLKKGFKELYGTTIYDYVQEQRMVQAKVLLGNPQLSIAQIADMIGFSNANSFSTAFKRIVGMQPSEWAKN